MTPSRNYPCPFDGCKTVCQNNVQLYRHKYYTHRTKEVCPYDGCNKQVRYLKLHVDSVHKKMKGSCEKCGKEVSKAALYQHKRTCMNEEPCPYSGCNKVLKNLRSHIQTVHEKVTAFCQYCGKEMAKASLYLHERESCAVNPGQVCHYRDCNKIVKNLKSHVQSVHEKVKSYCRYCKQEKTKSNLYQHEKKCNHNPAINPPQPPPQQPVQAVTASTNTAPEKQRYDNPEKSLRFDNFYLWSIMERNRQAY